MTRELDDRGHGRPILECLEPRVLLDGIAEQEAIEALGTSAVLLAAQQTETIDPRQLGPSSRRTGLIISEIMYHPPDPHGEDLEFIEITNTEPVPDDLSRYRLSGEIGFVFPEGTIIGGLDRLVVAADPSAVEAFYGITGVLGPFEDRLGNGGGTVRLRNQVDAILWETEYSDVYPWPAAADGAGHSLVLARPDYGEDSVEAWGASGYMYGSPGAADPTVGDLLSNVVLNEILAHTDLPQIDFIELYNYGTQSVDISGCEISDNPDPSIPGFIIPPSTTLGPGGFISFDQTQLGFSLSMHADDVYLRNPAGDRVLDALAFGAQANGVSLGRYPDGGPEVRVLSALSPGAPNDEPANEDIVINEIMYHPISGDSADEYVELYNRGGSGVYVDDWCFTQGIGYTFGENTLIPAGGYLVVAKDPARLIATHPGVLNATNTVGGFSGNLSDRGERIVLARPDDPLLPDQDFVVVDEVWYRDGESWGEWADGGGSSLELIDPHSDNMRAMNWTDSDETAKAPWTLVEHTGVLDHGRNAANEIHILLEGRGEALLDNVEVFKVGEGNRVANATFESGSGGWVIQGTHIDSHLETSEGYLSGQSLHLVASRRGDNSVNRVETDLTSDLASGNTATIRGRVRWLRGCPLILLRLHGNWLEAPGEMIVPANLGTPGEQNSSHAANAGPAIEDVAHGPVLPAPYEDVVVTARVADVDGLSSVLLKWRNDTAAPSNVHSLVMTDNGMGADAIAGDGIYSAAIPGQGDHDLVAFYVEGTDLQSVTTRFPWTAPGEECHVMFGQTDRSGAFGTYRFWMTEAARAEWSSRQKLSDHPIHGTFVYGDFRVVYNAGARYRGSPWIRSAGNPETKDTSFVFYTNKDDRLLGVTSYNLDRLEGDDTKQRERMSNWLADQVDTPFFYQRYVHLYVNEYHKGTIYGDSQQPNDDMVEYWWPDGQGGELFKIDDWFEFNDNSQVSKEFNENGQLRLYLTTGGELKKARYRWSWRKESVHGLDDDYTSFFEMVEAMNLDYTSPEYATLVPALVDYEEWMHVFAVEHIIRNWDSYGYNRGKNMSTYKPLDGKWQMIMWDLDHSHLTGSPTDNNLFSINCPTARSKFFKYPAFLRAYWRAISEVANGPMRAEVCDPIMDANYAAFQANGISVTNPNSALKQWIADRRAWLLGKLAGVAADFEITTNGGNDLSTDQQVFTLSGTAPVEAKAIHINGNPAAVTWTSVTEWTVELGLNPGDNVLTVEGLDSWGNVVGSDTITVTYTDPGVSPIGKLVINEIMYHPAVSDAEYIEIHNLSGTDAFDLSGWRLDGVDFTFGSGSIIRAGEHAVVAENITAFAPIYGVTAASRIIGEYGPGGGLANGGETLRLLMPAGAGLWTTVDEVTYDDGLPWPVNADGTGPSLQLIDLSQDNDRIGNWAVDPATPYTPGEANSVAQALPAIPDIRINEVQGDNVTTLADNMGDYDPWVELYSAGSTNLDDCYLTDDYTNLTKWAFPAGFPLATGNYALAWLDGEPSEQTASDLHTSFAIDALPGSLALVWEYGGMPIVVDYVDYAYAPADESSGRWPDGDGDLYRMDGPTGGEANSGPYVGGVVISEIHYNPDDSNDFEFIELYNRSGAPVNLWETHSSQDYGWALEGFELAAGTVLAAAEALVVVPFDPVLEPDELAAFEARYGLGGSGVQIVGGYGANLDNNGETLRLQQPDPPHPSDPLTALYADIDVVEYDDDSPWPGEADGNGASLNRVSSGVWGSDPASWQALSPTPGEFGVLADIVDVSPDPRSTSVSDITILFNEAVSGFDVGDLSLTRNGGANLLTTQALTTSDNIEWTLGGLSSLTAADGTYVLTLWEAGSGIVDGVGNPLYRDAEDTWLKDTVPPTADVIDVSPDPHLTAVEQIDVVFSEPVSGLDVGDLSLTRDGGGDLLTGAEGLATADGITWALTGLTALTDLIGTYTMVLTLTAAGSGIVDVAGNPLAGDASDTWVSDIPDTEPPTVQITAVSPDPRNVPVNEIEIVFSEPVLHVDVGDLTLTRSGGGNLLTTQPVTSADNITWTLGGLAPLTSAGGDYVLTLTAGQSGIADDAGNPLAGDASDSWVTDTQTPGADITDVDPDPRVTAVGEIDIVFDEPVTGLDAGDLSLTRDGGADLLTGSEPLSTTDNITWTLGGLTALTGTGGSGNFVAFNDHVPGPDTHVNTTTYSANAADTGLLKDIDTGVDTAVTLTMTAAGIHYAGLQDAPAVGTDAYEIFDGFVDLDGANGASIEINVGDHYTYTFSDLDAGAVVTYSFYGTAIRGNSDYTKRWTLVTLVGAEGTADHSIGDGVVTSAFNPALAANEVALWTGDNSRADQGLVIGWTAIDPGPDGTFQVVSTQYTGPVPISVDSGGVADGRKGYGISGIRLEELGATGLPGSYEVTLTAGRSGIQDAAGNPLAADTSDAWVIAAEEPTADIIDVTPDPRDVAVDEIVIAFSEPVSAFDIADLGLTRDGGANLLTTQPLETLDSITWTLGGLGGLTAAGGTYTLTLTAVGSGIQDASGNPLAGDASDTWTADMQPPTADAWFSAADHGDVGEVLLEIPDDGLFSEARMSGVGRLVIEFSEPIDPASFPPASVLMAGNDVNGQPVDLSSVEASTSTRDGDTVGVIDFAPALPDVVRYLVRIDGVTDANGTPLSGDDDRIFTALAGDASGDRRVNAIDLSYIWPRRTTQIDGATVSQTRSDVTGDGRVNAIDLSAAWPMRGANMQDVPDPLPPPASAGAGLSQGALDAAAALWTGREEGVTTAPADPATQPTDTALSSPAPPTADGLLSGVSGSPEPADVLAAPSEGEAEDITAASPSADLDPDLLDLLGVVALTTPLGD